jgi:hypothetical protein
VPGSVEASEPGQSDQGQRRVGQAWAGVKSLVLAMSRSRGADKTLRVGKTQLLSPGPHGTLAEVRGKSTYGELSRELCARCAGQAGSAAWPC